METHPELDMTENSDAPDRVESSSNHPEKFPDRAKKLFRKKAARISAAAVLAVGAGGPEVVRRFEAVRDDTADRARWEQLQQISPDIAPPPVKKLSAATAEQRDRIFAVRDKSFFIALHEAQQHYRLTGNGPKQIADLDRLIDDNLRHHSIARGDSVLESQGIPVMIDRPYPFIRFVEAGVYADSKSEQTMRTEHTEGTFETPYFKMTPDTMYINVDDPSLDPRHIVTHEETHWRLSSFPDYQGVKNTIRLDEDQLHALHEGLAERLTRQLLEAEGLTTTKSTYTYNVRAAEFVERRLGHETFWSIMERGGLVAVLDAIKKKDGAKKVSALLAPDLEK